MEQVIKEHRPALSRMSKRMRFIASLFLVTLCVQIVPIEGYGISNVKVAIMGLSPLLFLALVPQVSRALILGGLYWGMCLFCAYYNGDVRVSSVGYLGMFVGTFIVYYNLLRRGAFSLEYFTKLLRALILAYGIILIMQQAAMLVGLRNFWPINLCGQHFLSLTKLPSLSLEPSHSARILTVAMLGYWRCLELRDGRKPTIQQLFSKEHKRVTLLFGWSMLTMGSGTAFIGMGLLSLYFIQPRTCIYIVPLICALFAAGNMLGLEQMDRATRVTQAVAQSSDKEIIMEADGSAAFRVMPLINTLKTDLSQSESWFGNGTMHYFKKASDVNQLLDKKIPVVEQYGLIAFFFSLLLVFFCVIKKILSLETLIFLILFGLCLINIAYTWGAMLMFAGVKFFQDLKSTGRYA